LIKGTGTTKRRFGVHDFVHPFFPDHFGETNGVRYGSSMKPPNLDHLALFDIFWVPLKFPYVIILYHFPKIPWPQRWLESPSAKAIELQASSTVYTSVRPPAAGGMPSFAETLQQTGDVVTRALKKSPNCRRHVGWGRSSPRRGKIHQFKLKTLI